MAEFLSCISPKVDQEMTAIPHFAAYTLDESLLRSHNVNIFMGHIVNEFSATISAYFNPTKSPCFTSYALYRHCSESLLSFIEFKQFQQFLLQQILNSDEEFKILARKMRDSLEITNHKYRFTTYKSCILEKDAIHWLMETITNDNRSEAMDHFVNMIANGFLMRCTPSPSRINKDQALYRFLWDIVDVDLTTKPFAYIIPPSAIVSSFLSVEEKAYQLYRKYVVTDTDLEINVSGSIKKTLAKYVHEEEQRMDSITVLAILEVFETLSEEMHKYLEQSFARMDPIYKPLSAKVSKLLGLKIPSKKKRLHFLQIDEFDKIRRMRPYEMDEVQHGIFLDDLQLTRSTEDTKDLEKKEPTGNVSSRALSTSSAFVRAMRRSIGLLHRHRRRARSANSATAGSRSRSSSIKSTNSQGSGNRVRSNSR